MPDFPFMLAIAAAKTPQPISIVPFVAMLLAIALMPFIHQKWWERHYSKVALGLGAITAAYYIFGLHNGARMLHVGHEYVSFIALIGSLYVVAGGIHIQMPGGAGAARNSLFLFTGAVLANLIGTTGASMLLIRPWLRMNQQRIRPFHIVFFIFIVSNVGGCLTPIGDPPLFLGYLKGVPFFWVLEKCWAAWAIAVGLLLLIFFVFDRRAAATMTSENKIVSPTDTAFKVDGWHNIAFLALILGAVFVRQPIFLSEGLMLLAAVGSWFLTPKRVHKSNQFDFHPIEEVAWLFIGIFATMVPALDYLELHAAQLGLDSGQKFYWFTGLLSGALDNAPTYLTFLAAAMGINGLSLDSPPDVLLLAATHDHELIAISLGAVFFGALTYIGNGPNLMVKAIAERAGVKPPGFFAYIFRYALPILLLVLLLISLLFFSKWRVF